MIAPLWPTDMLVLEMQLSVRLRAYTYLEWNVTGQPLRPYLLTRPLRRRDGSLKCNRGSV
jgi:hypothetical protein